MCQQWYSPDPLYPSTHTQEVTRCQLQRMEISTGYYTLLSSYFFLPERSALADQEGEDLLLEHRSVREIPQAWEPLSSLPLLLGITIYMPQQCAL